MILLPRLPKHVLGAWAVFCFLYAVQTKHGLIRRLDEFARLGICLCLCATQLLYLAPSRQLVRSHLPVSVRDLITVPSPL